MNKVIITGRLVADPEIRTSQSGTTSCKFTVAVDRNYVDKESGKRESDFLTCVAFKQRADFLGKCFKKGSPILIEGNLRTGKYKDKNHDDVTHYTTEIYVDNIEFFSGGSNSNNNSQPAQQQTVPKTEEASLADYETISGEEVPF